MTAPILADAPEIAPAPQAPTTLFRGLNLAQIDLAEARIEAAAQKALRRVMRQVTAKLGETTTAAAMALVADAGAISPDDLSGIGPLWHAQVEQQLQPVVAQVYRDAGDALHASMVEAVGDLPRVSSVAAETYLAQSATTFDAIGAQLWETARAELIADMAAGDDIPTLAARLRTSVPDLTARQATLVARTQVNDAANAGSYATAQASGLDLVKGWESTADLRTRETHLFAGSRYSGPGMIPMAENFMVGGWPCERPHDPELPPAERYNCRCTLVYGMREAPPPSRGQFIAQLEAEHRRRLEALALRHQERLERLRVAHEAKMAALAARAEERAAAIAAARLAYQQRVAAMRAEYEARRAALTAEHQRRLAIARGEEPPPALPMAAAPAPGVEPVIPVAGQPTLIPVRQVLVEAQTIPQVRQAFIAEWDRIIAGQPGATRGMVRFSSSADVQTAREHAEGLLRGIERFPAVRMDVTSARISAYAQTAGREIRFASGWSGHREEYLASVRLSGARNAEGIAFHPTTISSPQGVALHEFGHVLEYAFAFDPQYDFALLGATRAKVRQIVAELADERGVPTTELVKLEIGEYAAGSTQELLAEAFADAMINGDAASELSRRIFAMLVKEYERVAPPRAGGLGGVAEPLATRAAPRVLPATDWTTRVANIRQLTEQPILESHEVGGALGQTRIITTVDGRRFIRKTYVANYRSAADIAQMTDAERLGGAVVDAIGVRAPAVAVESDLTIDMEFLPGEVLTGDIPQSILESEAGRRLGIADYLMANTDRGAANVLVMPDGELAAIDQGFAFSFSPRNTGSGLLVQAGSDFVRFLAERGGLRTVIDLRDIDLVVIRERLMALRPLFAETSRLDWYKLVMRRLAALEKAAARSEALPQEIAPVGRAIAETLGMLDAGTDLATIVESLTGRAELKDLLAIVRRAKDRDKLSTSLRGFATRRGITIPGKTQLKALQAAERKAAAAAKREAALAARAEKARLAEVKAQVKAVHAGDFRSLAQTDTGAYRAADGQLWTVESFASEREARERVLAMALRDLVDPGPGGPQPLAVAGQGAPGPGGWQVAYTGTVPRTAVTLDDWLGSASLDQLRKVTPARLRALAGKVGLGPDEVERLIARRADAVARETLMAKRFRSGHGSRRRG